MSRPASGRGASGFHITALGTGASSLNNGRASVGYVVHVGGEPRYLLDAGGGTAVRLSEAGVDLTALEAVFLGHLHVDHAVDVPAIVKAAYQQGRSDRSLAIYGPTGGGDLPGTEEWVSRLFDPADGAYGYLPGFFERYAGGDLDLEVTEVDAAVRGDDEVRTVAEREGATVEAIPVVHGRAPTLAYRFTDGDDSFTFSGDYASETDNVATLAEGTDVLVNHRLLEARTNTADPDHLKADLNAPDAPDDLDDTNDIDGLEDPKDDLHSTPRECGWIASAADAGTLLVSHVGRDDPGDLEAELEIVREVYDGRVVVPRDLVDVYPDGTVVDVRERMGDEAVESNVVLVLEP